MLRTAMLYWNLAVYACPPIPAFVLDEFNGLFQPLCSGICVLLNTFCRVDLVDVIDESSLTAANNNNFSDSDSDDSDKK